MNLTLQAHRVLKSFLSAGDLVIDATAGNGHDALFLARQVGETGRVFAFDIQARAIENTRQLLQRHDAVDRLSLFQTGHENLQQFISADYQQKISVIMFNLGYLPGSDKACITRPETTLLALQQAINLLKVAGVVSIMLYPGHKGGDKEAEAVMNWVEKEKKVSIIQQLVTKGPQFLLLQKIN